MTDSISRKEFLMKMGFKGAALMAVLTSCSKDNVNAQISPFTIDLNATTSAALNCNTSFFTSPGYLGAVRLCRNTVPGIQSSDVVYPATRC